MNERRRRLYYSDNLPVLRSMATKSIDLIYLDPPFNSNRTYNIIYPDDLGQVTAFEDTWYWTPQCEDYLRQIHTIAPLTCKIVQGMVDGLGTCQLSAYLVHMAVRLVEMHRIMHETASIFLHCDQAAGHYLKVIMDAIFGAQNFLSEVIWNYGTPSGGRTKGKKPIKSHDTILYYAKSRGNHYYVPEYLPYQDKYIQERFTHTDEDGRIYRTRKRGTLLTRQYLDQSPGIPLSDTWADIKQLYAYQLHKRRQEDLGYPTQKPLALLERILRIASKPHDTILDPFCGCGTSIIAAESMQRHWIGIDITYAAVAVIKQRFIRQRLNTWGEIEIINEPTTVKEVEIRLLDSSSSLFARKEFEKFCVATIGGLPNDKMGADGGVDGRIPLINGDIALCSVKSGKVSVDQLRSLNGLITGKNVAGVFITKESPTNTMITFANHAGLYYPPSDTLIPYKPFPRLQILTLDDMLHGKRPTLPIVTLSS